MEQNAKIYNLEERTSVFAEQIIDLCKTTPKDIVVTPLINQLIRSSTSIGANYFEANGASSKRDFQNKLHICIKESRETRYWLRLLAHSRNQQKAKCQLLSQEASELIRIFGKMISKSKQPQL